MARKVVVTNPPVSSTVVIVDFAVTRGSSDQLVPCRLDDSHEFWSNEGGSGFTIEVCRSLDTVNGDSYCRLIYSAYVEAVLL